MSYQMEKRFERYWKERQYRHPEETIKDMRIARKFYYAGWNNCDFYVSHIIKEEAKIKEVEK